MKMKRRGLLGNPLPIFGLSIGKTIDNITNAVYAAADEKMFAASGFTFSINASGNLIATI